MFLRNIYQISFFCISGKYFQPNLFLPNLTQPKKPKRVLKGPQIWNLKHNFFVLSVICACNCWAQTTYLSCFLMIYEYLKSLACFKFLLFFVITGLLLLSLTRTTVAEVEASCNQGFVSVYIYIILLNMYLQGCSGNDAQSLVNFLE